jgi:hypothetical protein
VRKIRIKWEWSENEVRKVRMKWEKW